MSKSSFFSNGTSLFDQYRDNHINSYFFRSIVWSAGNENSQRHIDDHDLFDEDRIYGGSYRKGTVAAGTDSEEEMEEITFVVQNNRPTLDLWYEGPPLEYKIVANFDAESELIPASQIEYADELNGKTVEAERDIEDSGTLRGIRFYFDNAAINDVFTIKLLNPDLATDANYHIWVGPGGAQGILLGNTINERTLADTGCARSVITVGACSKLGSGADSGTGETIRYYSSAGPTVDGRIKPEIVTLTNLCSPVNEAQYDVLSGDPDYHYRICTSGANPYSSELGGTSGATPLVAGAVALLFEAYGLHDGIEDLNQDMIKAILTANAYNEDLHYDDPDHTDFDPLNWNRYGYGRLRMLNAIETIPHPTDIDLWIKTHSTDVGMEPFTGGALGRSPDIRICETGSDIDATEIRWGNVYDVKINVHNQGDDEAVGAILRVFYTLPRTAPNEWFLAQDEDNNQLRAVINIPAHTEDEGIEFVFRWRPEEGEIEAPLDTIHFCMLVEINHPDDPVHYPDPSAVGHTAWVRNIRDNNNLALRNMHIE